MTALRAAAAVAAGMCAAGVLAALLTWTWTGDIRWGATAAVAALAALLAGGVAAGPRHR